MEEDEYYESVMGLLDKVSDQIERNNEYMQQLLSEVRYMNFITSDGIFESEKVKKATLDELDSTDYPGDNVLFVGYGRNELKHFLEKVAGVLGVNVKFSQCLGELGELAAALNSVRDGGIVLFDLREIIRIPGGTGIITEAIENKDMHIIIGQGDSSRTVKLPLRSMHIYLYSSKLVLSKELESCMSVIYMKE